jgi:mannan endo-1,4-beta-mannosidase
VISSQPSSDRGSRLSRTVAAVIGVLAVAAVAGIAAVASSPQKPTNPDDVPGTIQWHRLHPVHTPPLPDRPLSYIGVYELTSPRSYSGVDKFAAATGTKPNIALYYSGWRTPFEIAFAEKAHKRGAIPFVEMDPVNIPIAAISLGLYDTYLEEFADEVATYGHPVIISFGHEMNGSWYSWGYGHTPAATFIKAWRHIVDIFRLQGADNVTWIWTVNRQFRKAEDVTGWWPGSNYVTWVGIDGYYFVPANRFATTFAPTIDAIRTFTEAPILIAETGVGPNAGQVAGIPNLLNGIRDRRELGFVWFDVAQHQGLYHQNWRLEDNPPALAAFRNAVRGFE